ncbi:cupin domain-containing protein [Solirubrobacter sp. CPCC 204708]|uniref:Cupin domain-containing protein n=1 Tax=Solirubrobacter deserti TaxID=2282478 RepID=A0ABT4RPG6_9ACTN|nr:cupin domain-containing protein [Solirubrobacter deserti]MBE2319946.1 cupin domain-containing protein [Solirubrobacter deserti]MDA0140460.1 cupin domain-containing protein [Solirubrobacter deserti]
MERLKVGSDEIAIHARGSALLATEVTIPAGGGPPGLHRHPSEELYRVEAGRLTIYREHERIVATPGSVVHIPGGAAHTVRNESDEPARAYVVFSPGTEMEAFVRALAANPGDVVALAEAHGIEFVQ